MGRMLILVLAGGLVAGCKSVEREKAEARFEQAEEWYKISKYNEAKGLYKEALDLMGGDHPEAALGLANCYRELCKIESIRYIDGDEKNGIDVKRVQMLYQEAERFFLWALEKRPDYRDAHYGLGLLYYETAVNKTLVQWVCRNDAERLDFRMRKLNAARDRFEKAYALDAGPQKSGAPQEYLALIYNLLGVEVVRRNDVRGAVECFEKSYASAELYTAWIRFQLRLKTDAKVFDFFEARLRLFEELKADLDRSLAALNRQLAEQSAREGDAQGAIDAYGKALRNCDRYLAWLQKQTAPPGDPDFKTVRRKPVLELREQIRKALVGLGQSPVPPPAPDEAKTAG